MKEKPFNSFNENVERQLKNIENYAKVERIIAVVLIFIPLILFWADDSYKGDSFRPSISDYAFMCRSYWFGSLLSFAGALFIFNGALHLKGESEKKRKGLHHNPNHKIGRWYNIIFGIALLFVIYFNYKDYTFIHYAAAIVFYGGCALTMLLDYDRSWAYRIGMFLGTLVPLAIHFINPQGKFTLLHAEWVGLLIIAIHFVYESFQTINEP